LQISKIKLEQLCKSAGDELAQSKISWAVPVRVSRSAYIYSSEALCLPTGICRFLILISKSKRLRIEQQMDYQHRASRKRSPPCSRVNIWFLYCMVIFDWKNQYTKL